MIPYLCLIILLNSIPLHSVDCEVECPANTIVECNMDDSSDSTGVATCSDESLATEDDIVTPGSCTQEYTITRTWQCCNVATCEQTIEVVDTTSPQLSIPMDVTVECDSIPPPSAFCTDNCAKPKIGLVQTQTDGDCDNTFTLLRQFTCTDECDNESSSSQTITVEDTLAPRLGTAPADVTVQCAEDVPLPTELRCIDNCDANPMMEVDDKIESGECQNKYTLTRVWKCTDDCGNESQNQTQTIIVDDITPPVLDEAPEDITIQCADQVPEPAVLTCTDNCNAAVDVNVDDQTAAGDCENKFTLTRVWICTDECDNDSPTSQIITVEDTTSPIFDDISDVQAECDAIPEPTCTDNCDANPDISFSDTRVNGTCRNEYTLNRELTCTDECGNNSTEIQTITVVDTTDPTLNEFPSDIEVNVDSIPPPTQLMCADNCDSNPTIQFSEQRGNGISQNEYKLIRTWICTDECGNESSHTQTITVVDNSSGSSESDESSESDDSSDNEAAVYALFENNEITDGKASGNNVSYTHIINLHFGDFELIHLVLLYGIIIIGNIMICYFCNKRRNLLCMEQIAESSEELNV